MPEQQGASGGDQDIVSSAAILQRLYPDQKDAVDAVTRWLRVEEGWDSEAIDRWLAGFWETAQLMHTSRAYLSTARAAVGGEPHLVGGAGPSGRYLIEKGPHVAKGHICEGGATAL